MLLFIYLLIFTHQHIYIYIYLLNPYPTTSDSNLLQVWKSKKGICPYMWTRSYVRSYVHLLNWYLLNPYPTTSEHIHMSIRMPTCSMIIYWILIQRQVNSFICLFICPSTQWIFIDPYPTTSDSDLFQVWKRNKGIWHFIWMCFLCPPAQRIFIESLSNNKWFRLGILHYIWTCFMSTCCSIDIYWILI